MMTEHEKIQKAFREERVATVVWKWLQDQKTFETVPWVSDPMSQKERETRNQLLADLEKVILNNS